MKIKFKIKQICQERHIGIRELSKISGVSIGSIQVIFKNEIAGNTSFVSVLKLAKALEINVAELYEIEE